MKKEVASWLKVSSTQRYLGVVTGSVARANRGEGSTTVKLLDEGCEMGIKGFKNQKNKEAGKGMKGVASDSNFR
jgi:hypothetical protein